MDTAIVTGASSSLGLAISKRLIQLGFRVYGLGGDYTDCALQNVNFKPVSCDLSDPEAVESAAKSILEKEKGVLVLVNNAKYFGRNRFEEMGIGEVDRILRINLLCPLILVRTLSESLKSLQGYIIQLGASFAESSRGGAAGAAASGGLKWMGETLFHDLRNYGVKVCHLSPEPNHVRDARKTVRSGAQPTASIDPEAIAQAVEQVLQNPFGNIVTEMVLRPLRIDEPDLEPVKRLPYPEPQPIPYTVPREFIEAEDQLEEEEYQKKQEEKRQRRQGKKPAAKQQGKEAGGRPSREKKPEPREPRKPQPSSVKDEEKPAGESSRPRRRGRRKPRPPMQEVGFLPKSNSPVNDSSANRGKPETSSKQEKTVKRDDSRGAAPRKDTPKPAEKVAKKATKKAARKRPAKKTVKSADSVEKSSKPAPVKKSTPAKKANPAKKAVPAKKSAPAKKAARKRAPKKAAKATESGKDSA